MLLCVTFLNRVFILGDPFLWQSTEVYYRYMLLQYSEQKQDIVQWVLYIELCYPKIHILNSWLPVPYNVTYLEIGFL